MPFFSDRECFSRSVTPMPPLPNSDSTAKAIHEEIERIVRRHRGWFDSCVYNGGTIVSLALTGAATVLATTDLPSLWAAVCSAIAAFVIATQRSLDFGGRWRWHLQRRTVYWALGYRLSSAALEEADQRAKAYTEILRELAKQSASEAFLPGSGNPVAEPDTPLNGRT